MCFKIALMGMPFWRTGFVIILGRNTTKLECAECKVFFGDTHVKGCGQVLGQVKYMNEGSVEKKFIET